MIRIWSRIDLRVRLAALAAVAVIAAPAAWYLGSPLFISRAVDESFPTATRGGGPVAGAPTARERAAADRGAARSNAVAQQDAGPVALARGAFGDVDAVHKGQGSATLYRLPDGRTVLRLEDFRVTNGPGLYVYLSGHPAPRSRSELHDGAAFEVAALKGNVGNQNYELPPGLDLTELKSAVIYCKPFSFVFSTAELTAAASGSPAT